MRIGFFPPSLEEIRQLSKNLNTRRINLLSAKAMRDIFLGADIHLNQGEGALGLLSTDERADATRLLEMCRSVWNDAQVDPSMTREAGRLVEVLARRSSRAMPFAALGRALLADLHGSPRDRDALLTEFQNKLTMLGL